MGVGEDAAHPHLAFMPPVFARRPRLSALLLGAAALSLGFATAAWHDRPVALAHPAARSEPASDAPGRFVRPPQLVAHGDFALWLKGLGYERAEVEPAQASGELPGQGYRFVTEDGAGRYWEEDSTRRQAQEIAARWIGWYLSRCRGDAAAAAERPRSDGDARAVMAASVTCRGPGGHGRIAHLTVADHGATAAVYLIESAGDAAAARLAERIRLDRRKALAGAAGREAAL